MVGGDEYFEALCDDGIAAIEPHSNLILAELASGSETARPRKKPNSSGETDGASADAFGDGAALHDPVAHADNPILATEHAALLALVPDTDATHIAIADGGWFVPATWKSGKIPVRGAKVLIPHGIMVTYDRQSDEPIFSLRVDGALRFATDADSRLIADTVVITSLGRLEIGTASSPVMPDVRAELLIAGDGDIDLTQDPMLLSRGVLSHGIAEIHGAKKTPFLRVGEPPKRGDTKLVLEKPPQGWRAGDRLIVTGTVKQGWGWDNGAKKVLYHPSQDEVVTITSVDGVRVTIDRPLQFNHYAPRKDLAAYVANTTRNIVFASLAGAETPVHHRGHVMFMHGDAVDIRYAAFDHLGRTDKSREAFDLAALPELSSVSNIKGRYSLHLHRTGMERQDAPAMVVGNSVFGSPGWGFVQHSSHADFVENVAFDVFGAAFAAEDGDETGIWLRNIAIRAQGFDWGEWSAKTGIERHDNGRTGDGFFFAGRLVEAAENVAANTTHGFVWMHRSAPSSPRVETIDHPEIAYGMPMISPDAPPIQGFRDNEAFGTEVGLIVIKSNPAQGHDVRTVLDGFLNWETRRAVDLGYTGHYTLLEFDLVGTARKGFFAPETGFTFGTNAFDIVLNRIRLTRFPVGFDMTNGHTFPVADSDVGYVLIGLESEDVGQDFEGFSSSRHRLLAAADLVDVGPEGTQHPAEIRSDADLTLRTDKRDSLGLTTRQNAADSQQIQKWNIPDLLRATGYFTGPEGQKIVLIPDLIADRATGALKKQSFVATLSIPDAELASWGVVSRGAYDTRNAAPVARDDSVSAWVDQPVIIDALINDTDPDSDVLVVEGATDPRFGDVVELADGRLLYRPNLGYAGQDEFTYWAADGAGNFAPAKVRITVGQP